MSHDPSTHNAPAHVVVVGAGHAGGRVVQHLGALGFAGRITLVGDERHPPYERPALSKEWLTCEQEPWSEAASAASTPASTLTLAPGAFWEASALRDARIDRLHDRAVALDAAQRVLTLASGAQLPFDRLVVATGGAPRDGAIPGARQPGVHLLRTIDDSVALRRALRESRGLAIIGAGVIGMEVASSARELGVPVTVLEAGPRVLARCLPPAMSEWLVHEHRARGVRVELGVAVEEIAAGDEANGAGQPGRYVVRCRKANVDADGDAASAGAAFDVAADTILIAIGVDCTPAFLDGTGFAGRQGVDVDVTCRSPRAPWLYAVGDVAHVLGGASPSQGLRQETWRNAENQALAVAQSIVGEPRPYRETPWMWTDQLGYNIQVVGQPDPRDEVVMRGEPGAGPCAAFSVRDGRVVAGVLVNAGRERRFLEKLVESGAPVDLARLADARTPLRELAA
ncbi:3-phenylpropionate/trans-cinnamate dioxygenase ferredoxin reductase subunit [Paraburkholderia unamae]|uniref:NAD(P)/FAD-dependent oxidoreductase n=1 Tax=Paraburkholderia unamae TaxID=219649 RepID=UPI000DC3CB0A|nr:FAD-dependent oxidoreductase [Paraburkholderia unamae]RAR57565.1 3-phenylpropionate/trans-cinnamate dioxygenase ferredoxin reductase subunit [Paraburkholderia unamae]